MYTKLIPFFSLLFFLQTTPTYVITHQYFYSTPLSMLLVRGFNGDFLDAVRTYDQEDLYFALTEFIRLRPLNRSEFSSPSIKTTLNNLHKKLTHRIKQIENQIKYQYPIDYEALTKSVALLSAGATSTATAYYLHNTKDPEYIPIKLASFIFGLLFLCGSATYFDDIRNPNRDNKYVKKYQDLLLFIKKLQLQDYSEDERYVWRQIIFVSLFVGGIFATSLAIPHFIA
ncbi:MAG TPA: hypothetical protein VKU36_03370 [Candidatus Babeliales bacterium]|nr:hypothetical protein [Candidatus Babeliales bacterium]